MGKTGQRKTRGKRESKLVGEARADWERLKAKWAAFSAATGHTQDWLAGECGWTTQGAVTQYLNGYTPINLTALLRFAKAMGFQPEEVSPTLAKDIEPFRVRQAVLPFSDEAIEAAKYVDKRPPEQRPGVVVALKLLSGEATTDTRMEEVGQGVFIAPNSPLRKQAARAMKVKTIPGPAGDAGDAPNE